MNGNVTSSSANINTISIPALTNGGSSRLAPGGAELNLLPSNSTTPMTNNGAIYRNQGKLIVKGKRHANRKVEFYFIHKLKFFHLIFTYRVRTFLVVVFFFTF